MIVNGAITNLDGIVLLDSLDLNKTVLTALSELTGASCVAVLNFSSERHAWNMYRRIGDEHKRTQTPSIIGIEVEGATFAVNIDQTGPHVTRIAANRLPETVSCRTHDGAGLGGRPTFRRSGDLRW